MVGARDGAVRQSQAMIVLDVGGAGLELGVEAQGKLLKCSRHSTIGSQRAVFGAGRRCRVALA